MSWPQRRQLLCMLCQWRSFSTSYRRFAEPPAPKSPPTARPGRGVVPPPSEQLAQAPRSYGRRTEDFKPTPLSRPIGMPYPPEEGQNTGIDNRSLLQKRDEFAKVSSDERWSKHLERREELKEKFRRPYFRDWGNLRFHKGKTFFPPPRPFKGDLSLYFPNLYGQTLLKGGKETVRDTTPALRNKISVVSIFSGTWAEKQTKTFVATPVVELLLNKHKDVCQHVRINVEDDGLKRMLIKLFKGGIRREIGEPNWDKYFIVKNELSDEVRENVGLLNSKVGYVYLVDSQCRIRWAGSGEAQDDEKEGLAKGLQRLILEKTEPKTAA